MADAGSDKWRFAQFELDGPARALSLQGRPVKLGGRAFDLLVELVRERHRVVPKSELMDRVWPGLVVEENNLTVQISVLRRALGPGVLATVPGRGYRFTAEVEEPAQPGVALDGVQPATPLGRRVPGETPAGTLAEVQARSAAESAAELIGRDADLAALEAAMAGHRLVTVIGAGGIGKTALARSLFARKRASFAHGGCWVELAPLGDADAVPPTIAAAAGVAIGAGEPRSALGKALAPLQLLLVLDNAEHLLPQLADAVQSLLDEAPGLRILVTSQRPLQRPTEQRFRLEPLSVPPALAGPEQVATHGAVQLFVARARAHRRGFALDDHNAHAVSALCRLLDGSPLALELAAARMPLLGLTALIEGLGRRLSLLSGGAKRPAGRQHSLREAMDWSCNLLSAPERETLARMAVFAGPADLPLMQAVLGNEGHDEWALLDVLETLVDASLVTVSDDASPRYGLLETPRAWAQEHLQHLGEAATLHERHARALAARARRHLEEFEEGRTPYEAWLSAIEPLFADVRAALAWAAERDVPSALLLAALLAAPGRNFGHHEKLRQHQTVTALLRSAAAGLPEALEPAARARTALAAALTDSHPDLSAAHAAAAADTWAAAGEGRARLHCMALVALALATARTDTTRAAAALEAALALVRPDWPAYLQAELAGAEGKVAYFAGDMARSRTAMHVELRWRAETGSTHNPGLANLMMVERAAGNAELAVQLGQRLIGKLAGSRAERTLHYARLNLVGAALDAGNLALARTTLAEGWPAIEFFGLRRSWLQRLMELARKEERPKAAFRLAHAIDAQRSDGLVPEDPEDREDRQVVIREGRSQWPESVCKSLEAEALGLSDAALYALGTERAER